MAPVIQLASGARDRHEAPRFESNLEVVEIEELDLESAVRSCLPDWSWFHRRAGVTPFLRPDYLAGWARAMGLVDACRCVIARRGGELVGFGPFLATKDPFGPSSVPSLRFLGGNVGFAGDALYGDIGAIPPRAPIVRAILEAAARWRLPKWDLGFLPESSETHGLARLALGAPSATLPSDLVPYVGLSLPPDHETYLRGLSESTRRNFRRRFRNLSEAGDVDLRMTRSPEPVARTVREMIANHDRWWSGTARADWFGDARVKRLLPEAAQLLAAQGQFLAFSLNLAAKPIAWSVGAFDGSRYFEQYISFDRAFAEYSPGLLIGILAARNLIETGANRMELGPGSTERKRNLGGTETPYRRLRGYRGWRRAVTALRDTWSKPEGGA